MKKLFLILPVFAIVSFFNFSSHAGGLYLAAEGAYANSSSSSSLLNGVSSVVPAVTLGYHLIGGEKGKKLGFEGGWRKHSYDNSTTTSGITSSFKYDIATIHAGLRYWFWYLSLKAGYARHSIDSTLTVASVSASSTATESDFYFGGGIDIPISAMFDFFADYTLLAYASNFSANEFSVGVRWNF